MLSASPSPLAARLAGLRRWRRGLLCAMALLAGVAALLAIHIAQRRAAERVAAALAADHAFVANLFGGERGLALLRHPRDASAWRLRGGVGRPVVVGPRQHETLAEALTDVRSYDRAGAPRAGPADAAVRLEDELGSLSLLMSFDAARLDVYIDGSRIGQASIVPLRPRLLALVREILAGDPIVQTWR